LALVRCISPAYFYELTQAVVVPIGMVGGFCQFEYDLLEGFSPLVRLAHSGPNDETRQLFGSTLNHFLNVVDGVEVDSVIDVQSAHLGSSHEDTRSTTSTSRDEGDEDEDQEMSIEIDNIQKVHQELEALAKTAHQNDGVAGDQQDDDGMEEVDFTGTTDPKLFDRSVVNYTPDVKRANKQWADDSSEESGTIVGDMNLDEDSSLNGNQVDMKCANCGERGGRVFVRCVACKEMVHTSCTRYKEGRRHCFRCLKSDIQMNESESNDSESKEQKSESDEISPLQTRGQRAAKERSEK